MTSSAPDKAHPIFTKKYAIFTPAIDELAKQIGEWVADGVTGGYVWGPSRYGKTRAVHYFLSEMLEERFGQPIPLIIVGRTIAHTAPGPFFSDILQAAHQKYWNSRQTPRKKQQMCVDLIISMTRDADTNIAVLLIDEAQTMTDRELVWLTGLQNDLDIEGVILTVIQVGSHQLDYVHSIQALTGNAHVSARFFVRSAQFHGLRSEAQLEYVLTGYEEDSEWPLNSGISFTNAFGLIPGDLSSQASLIWGIFLDFFPDGYRKQGVAYEIPMQHLARTVEYMLKAHMEGASWSTVCDRNTLVAAIRKTAIERHLQLVSAALLKMRKRTQ